MSASNVISADTPSIIDSHLRRELPSVAIRSNYEVTWLADKLREIALEGPQAFSLPIRFVPLLAVRSKETTFRAVNPIRVHVYKEDEFYVAENESLAVYGIGATHAEAMASLQSHIVHFWRYYSSLSSDQVTGDAVRLKRAYANLLMEET